MINSTATMMAHQPAHTQVSPETILDLKPKAMRAWAADKSTEIRGAVQNYLGSLRRSKRPSDLKARERLEINRGVLLDEVGKMANASDMCK